MNKLQWNRYDTLMILIFTVVSVVAVLYYGNKKVVDFCDEAYSYESANSVWKELSLHSGEWVTGKSVSDYFAATDTWFNHGGIESHLWADHLPLYFYIFRFVSLYIFPGSSTPWIGIGINLLVFIPFYILIYGIMKKLIRKTGESFIGTLLFVTMGNVIVEQVFLIRVYLLFSFLCIGTFYITGKIVIENIGKKWYYAMLYLVTATGFLTHYYYWIFCAVTVIVCTIFLLIKKKFGRIGASALMVLGGFFTMTLVYSRWRDGILTYLYYAEPGTGFDFLKVVGAAKTGLSNLIGMFSCGRFSDTISIFILGGILVFGIIKLFRSKNREITLWVLLGMTISVGYIFLISFVGERVQERYFYPGNVIFLLCLCVLIVTPICDMNTWKNRVTKGIQIAVLAGIFGVCGIIPNSIYFERMNSTYQMNEMLKGYADIPWVFAGTTTDWTFYQIVFDLKIPEKIKKTGNIEERNRDKVIEDSGSALLYNLGMPEEKTFEYVEAAGNKRFSFQKLMDKNGAEIFLCNPIENN